MTDTDPFAGMRDKGAPAPKTDGNLSALRDAISSSRDDNEIANRAPTAGFVPGDNVTMPDGRSGVVSRVKWHIILVRVGDRVIGFEPRFLTKAN
jgi:hypothetical protein